jgi:hypothetical protein
MALYLLAILFSFSSFAQLEDYDSIHKTYPDEDQSFVKRQQTVDATCRFKRRTVYEDLKGAPTEAMKVPVVDQNGTGDCYAFSTTQAIEIHNRLNGVKKGCERLHWAWGSAKSKKYSSTELKVMRFMSRRTEGSGGLSEDVFKAALDQGYCPYENVSKAFARYRKELKMTDAEVMAFFYQIYEFNDQNGSDFKSTVTKAFRSVKESETAICSEEVFKLAEELRYVNFGPVILKSAWGKLEKDIDQSCAGSPKCGIVTYKNSLKKPELVTLDYKDNFNDKDKLDNIILKNLCDVDVPRPMVLHFCQNMITSSKTRVSYNKNGEYIPKSIEECGGHAAVIAGYREHPKSGEKQILIRNSYGASDKPSSVECECRSDSGVITPCKDIKGAPSLKNENIGCWYPLKRVMETSRGLNYVR